MDYDHGRKFKRYFRFSLMLDLIWLDHKFGEREDYYDYAEEEPIAFSVQDSSEYDYDNLLKSGEDAGQLQDYLGGDYNTNGLFDDDEEGKQDNVGLLDEEPEETKKVQDSETNGGEDL